MYEGWRITRWETPVVDIDRLLMVSLSDAGRELVVVLESAEAAGRPRWRVRFRRYPAYRSVDEMHLTPLWEWLDRSGQRCGSTFTVEETPALGSWAAGQLAHWESDARHHVIATLDDVIEVLACEEATWESIAPAAADEPLPGKSTHLRLGEDDEAIQRLREDLRRRQHREPRD